MLVDTSSRSNAAELMDNFDLKGEILIDALNKIAKINQLLGGNQITIKGIKELIKNHKFNGPLKIADLGCGNGDMLRKVKAFALKQGLSVELTGIDANPFTIEQAKKQSAGDPDIRYKTIDIFEQTEQADEYDVILCTLTLHHFKDHEILLLLHRLHQQSHLGIVINDLHRSKIAYYLFKVICFLFQLNEMSRQDGLTSILRGFKRKDLELFSVKLGIKTYLIKWKWAFRYQWIIRTYEQR